MTALYPVTVMLATLSPAASGDEALPGRDGNYQLSGTESVEGTVWKGETNPGQIFITRFERGGILSYTSPSGTFRNGKWKQSGNTIYLEMNNQYAEYRGVIHGDRILGEAKNVTGLTWKWDVKRSGTIANEERPPMIGRDPLPGRRIPPRR